MSKQNIYIASILLGIALIAILGLGIVRADAGTLGSVRLPDNDKATLQAVTLHKEVPLNSDELPQLLDGEKGAGLQRNLLQELFGGNLLNVKDLVVEGVGKGLLHCRLLDVRLLENRNVALENGLVTLAGVVVLRSAQRVPVLV